MTKIEKITTVIDTTPLTSLKALAKATNLSKSEVKDSLASHPKVKEKVLAQLKKNKDEQRALKKNQNNKERNTCRHESMQNLEDPNIQIMKYLFENRDKFVLLSNDNNLISEARKHGIQTKYLKNAEKPDTNLPTEQTYKQTTLLAAKRIEGGLIISTFDTDYRSISVFSQGIEHTNGVYELNIGDEVFVAKNHNDYVSFAHYKVSSLYSKNNCILIYSKRLYNMNEIVNLPRANYKSFMKDFKHRLNL